MKNKMKKIIIALFTLLLIMPAVGHGATRKSHAAKLVAQKKEAFMKKASRQQKQQSIVPADMVDLDSIQIYNYDELTEKYAYFHNTDGFSLIEDRYLNSPEGQYKYLRVGNRTEDDGSPAIYRSFPGADGNWQYSNRTIFHDGGYERYEVYNEGQWQLESDTELSFDAQGRLMGEKYISVTDGVIVTEGKNAYTYNDAGKIATCEYIDYEEEDTVLTTYTYSESNPYLIMTATDKEDNVYVEQYSNLGDTVEYRILENGKLDYVEKSLITDNQEYCEYFEYDNEGQVEHGGKYLRETTDDELIFTTWAYDAETKQLELQMREVTGHDAFYRYHYSEGWIVDDIVVYVYDDHDNLSHEIAYVKSVDELNMTGKKLYFYNYTPSGIKTPGSDAVNPDAPKYNFQGMRIKSGKMFIQNGKKYICE